MTLDDLSLFHQATGLRLPQEITEIDPIDPLLELDVQRLIQINLDVRRPGGSWIGSEGGPWPDEHVVIGEDGCGDFFTVKYAEGFSPSLPHADTMVWRYNHDWGRMEEFCKNLEEFSIYARDCQ